MDSDIIDVVSEWESTPISGGYTGLHDLADREFTGAVSEGSVWAFVLNGKVIGVFDGSIEAFEGADATAYQAPDPALPLLYAMQAGESETRAKYYSNDTPLSSADATLSSGNFTGYIELSENVLSGDYYVVYYGGKSMSVAYVGNNRSLLAGDEAFERADDEVGIYKVNEASIDIVEIPAVAESADEASTEPTNAAVVEQSDDESESTDEAETAAPDNADSDVAFDDAEESEPTVAADKGREETPTPDATAAESTASTTETDVADEPSPAEETADETAVEPPRAGTDEPEPVSASDAPDTDSADGPGASTPEPVPDATPDSAQEQTQRDVTGAAGAAAAGATGATGATDAAEDVFSEEAEWREATSIPALDPKKSNRSSKSENGSTQSTTAVNQQTRKRRRQSANRPEQRRQQQAQSQSPATAPQQSSVSENGNPQQADVARLKQRLQATAEQRDALETARERLAAERDEYREEADQLQSRVSELEAEVERLERELSDLREESPTTTTSPTQTMSADAALDGTNLFVRYGTKSGGTLEKAHAGSVERTEVNENLRLEHHTGFETDGVVVDGTPYESFLDESIEYGFVRWVVEDLLYEIRETGNQGTLDELFDAIPKIDRAELHGNVTLQYTEDGEEHREQQTFDVVLRDRMGNPLVVANLNGSRDPATEGMMTSLVENTSRLRESNESLGAAFLVTASYFDPGALETAADATGGGLLSRGRRKSFVKLSRKQGFHLCLVETRNGDFHLNVPEL